MDKTTDPIKEKIRRHQPELRQRFKTKRIGVFGSHVHGQPREDSDVDILVEFAEPIGFFTFLDLEEYLEDVLGKKVDLTTRRALKPHIGEKILQQVTYI